MTARARGAPSDDRRTDDDMKPIERPMPSISFIVARSSPGDVIGCENQLPWRLRTDMRFFRQVTEGHTIIMGRKTYESLGKPLPKRKNIILSKSPGEDSENLYWTTNREMALFLADMHSILDGNNEIIVIGGAQIYEIFSDLFTKIYLTEVFHEFDCGDAYFRIKFDGREWNTVESKNYDISEFDEYRFRISVLERKNKYVRHRELSDFYVGNDKIDINRILPRLKENLENPRQPTNDELQSILPLLVA